MAEAKDYIKRMLDEKEEYEKFIEKMAERKRKLLTLLNGDSFRSLSDNQKELLYTQASYMTEVLLDMCKLKSALLDRIYEEKSNA